MTKGFKQFQNNDYLIRGNGSFNVRVYLIENALARFKEVSKPKEKPLTFC